MKMHVIQRFAQHALLILNDNRTSYKVWGTKLPNSTVCHRIKLSTTPWKFANIQNVKPLGTVADWGRGYA